MSQLGEAQEAFWRAAYVPGAAGAPDARRAVLAAGPGLPPGEALALYGAAARLRDTLDLAHDFPLLSRGLGEDDFAALCAGYLSATQGRRPPLGRLGAEMWAYLEREGRPRAQVELAALEDMRAAAALARDVPPAPASALAAAGDGQLGCRFSFVPALQHRRCTTDLARMSADPGALCRPGSAAAEAHELVVWRRGLDILQARLVGPQAAALRLASAGATLLVICGAFEGSPTAADDAAACLGAWFADGWVARVA